MQTFSDTADQTSTFAEVAHNMTSFINYVALTNAIGNAWLKKYCQRRELQYALKNYTITKTTLNQTKVKR